MRRTITFYLLAVVASVCYYSFSTIGWISSKAVGRVAFPGSPDWDYMYVSAFERFLWMSGMLFGLALGGAALFAITRANKPEAPKRLDTAMLVASVILPVAALVAGCSAERSTIQGTSVVSKIRSNQSLNRTRSGMPPSGLISFWPFGVLPSRAG